MSETTDPARELAELCERLAKPSKDKRGDAYLAEKFGVQPWSTEFFQIVFWILDRADLVAALIPKLDYDEDIKVQALGHIAQIKQGFGRNALLNTWDAGHSGPTSLAPEHTGPIKMLSSPVRKLIQYPKLDAEEVEELTELVSSLEDWLLDNQLVESDFIREALIEGLRQFKFRLERTNWLGWGYAVESLREVVAAYMALDRKATIMPTDEVSKAMLVKVGSVVKKIYEKTAAAKDVADVGDFVLRAYGAATIAVQGLNSISGLLPSP